jgi:hypothetical protein
MKAIHGEHHASLDELFVVLAHIGQELWIGGRLLSLGLI